MPEENSFLSNLLGGGNLLGEGGTIGNLLQNKIFLQGLASAGAAIGGRGSVGAALGGAAVQNIQAQNYSKLLSRILGQGGKMTLGDGKFSLTGPSSILSGDEQVAGATSTGQPNPFLLAP